MSYQSEIFKPSYLKTKYSWYLIILAIVLFVVYYYFKNDISEGFENGKNQFFNSQTTILSSPDNSMQSGTAIKYVSNNELYIKVFAHLLLLDQHIYKDKYNTNTIKHEYKVYLSKTPDAKERVLIGKLEFGSDKIYKLIGKTDISANLYRYISVNISAIDGTLDSQVLFGQFEE
jgi:hypothetical protein